MLIDNQKIKTKWTHNNKNRLESKGYKFTSYGDSIEISPIDLSPFSHQEVQVQCDYCGAIRSVIYANYVKSHKTIDKDACTHCVGKKCAEITLKARQDDYYKRLLSKCEENGYRLLSDKSIIENNTTYIKYECPTHGVKTMRVANLLSGKKCPECLAEMNRKRFQHDQEYIVNRVRECGGELLNPEEYINQSSHNLKVLCPSCHQPFTTSFVVFVQHGGQLCKECSTATESNGERKIRLFLEEHCIPYEQHHWFSDCRDIKPLPFDFYLRDYNLIIEFDGRQHFSETGYFTYSYEETHRHDMIKNQYCIDNNIDLIRIPYWDMNHINEILSNKLKIHTKI